MDTEEEPKKKITDSIKEKAAVARNAIVFKALKIGFLAKNAKDKVVEKASSLKASSAEKVIDLKEHSVEAFGSLKDKVFSKKEVSPDEEKQEVLPGLLGNVYRKPGKKENNGLVKIKSVPWFNCQLITPVIIIMIGVCFIKWLEKECECLWGLDQEK